MKKTILWLVCFVIFSGISYGLAYIQKVPVNDVVPWVTLGMTLVIYVQMLTER